MKDQFSCVKHFGMLAELSFPLYSPGRQARAHMKPTTYYYLRECFSETTHMTLLWPQPAARCTWNEGFPLLEGQSVHAAVLVQLLFLLLSQCRGFCGNKGSSVTSEGRKPLNHKPAISASVLLTSSWTIAASQSMHIRLHFRLPNWKLALLV